MQAMILTAPQRSQTVTSILKTRASRWAQVMGHVEVHVQVQRTAESLHQGDGAALRLGLHLAGFLDEEGGDRRVDDGQSLTESGRLAKPMTALASFIITHLVANQRHHNHLRSLSC